MTNLEYLLGAENAETLRLKAGGTRVLIPGGIEETEYRTSLEDKFGANVVALLIFHFPGDLLYIPRGPKVGILDDRRVAKLTKAGRSADDIALELQCSDRAVRLSRARCRSKGLLPS